MESFPPQVSLVIQFGSNYWLLSHDSCSSVTFSRSNSDKAQHILYDISVMTFLLDSEWVAGK